MHCYRGLRCANPEARFSRSVLARENPFSRPIVAETEFMITLDGHFSYYLPGALLAPFGPHAVSDLSPECVLKQTSADHSEFPGSRRRFVDLPMRLQSAPNQEPLEVSLVQPATIPVSPCDQFPNFRNFACQRTQISSLIRTVPSQQRGVRTSRTWGGMRWTRAVRVTNVLTRTSKSCGSDAPMLASSLR